MKAFSVTIDRVGYFRQGRQRGVVWAGGDAPESLEHLSRDLREALKARQVSFDEKPLVPHVTLLRDARPPDGAAAIEAIEWVAMDFVLVESTRDEAGVCYRVVGRFGGTPIRG